MSDHESSTEISPALEQDLHALKRALEPLSTPDYVEANLQRALAAQLASTSTKHLASQNWFARVLARSFSRVAHWLAPGVALAASVAMAMWMVRLPAPSAGSNANAEMVANISEDDNPFVSLQSLDRIALEPSPRIIETNIPRMLLANYGVSVSPETAGDQVRAQMLVSASGQPLAFRLSAYR
jgi:hypothetical protein